MTAFIPEFRADMTEHVRRLRAADRTFVEIGLILGLCPETCRQMVCPAQWPKVVTRVEADGTAMVIRVP